MILSFSKKFPWGDPTGFVDKIKSGDKIHSIRTPRKGNTEWREGMDIHFATGIRTPDYNQFESGVCTGIQKIEIKFNPERTGREHIPSRVYIGGDIFWDNLNDESDKIIGLAENDGFDFITDFFMWFDEDFEGRLIHWADKRY